MEQNLVEMWLKKDPVRWVAGALAGLFAGAVALGVSVIAAKSCGTDPMYALKFMALPFAGASAISTEPGVGAVALGVVLFEALAAFWGVVYAHFTKTNAFWPLAGMGFTWGAFSWIFWANLYTPAWRPVFEAAPKPGSTFFFCMTYGFALVSVSVFDRMFRGSSR
ncbi:MAG: hypothetical protein AB7P04_15760 [Bacteriovoracia bacterium]